MKREYRYDAFISYRHTEPDKFVAERLHKELESFRLPRSIAKKRKGQKTKIERVFRDKDELPLTSNLEDPIIQALQSTEWLIVICSPRLRESMWCKKEIETFVALRGREHVLAVLIEGEPSESFPDELLYRIEKRKDAYGAEEEVRIPVEPLAADIRGKNKRDILKAMKTEKLRLLAAMFELPYDDLRQRHRERKMRQIVTASLIGGAACLLFGMYSTATALRIQNQKAQIQQQADEILEKSQEILRQNEELALRQAGSLAEKATNYLEAGDRASAVQTAVEALTESAGVEMPYTPEAQFILAESLRAYDTGNIWKAAYQYETAGRIECVKKSPDSDTLAIYDDVETITLFDLKKAEVIDIIGAEEYDAYGAGGFTFLGKDKFAYISAEEEVSIYDLTRKELVKTLNTEDAFELTTDTDGMYLVVKQWLGSHTIYDGETLEEIGVTPDYEDVTGGNGPFLSPDGIFADIYPVESEDGKEEYNLYFVDVNTMKELSICSLGTKLPKDIQIQNGIAYVMSAIYSEGYTDCDTYTFAVDISTGELRWEFAQRGRWPGLLDLPVNEGATDLINITTDEFALVNMQTGEVSFSETLASAVVESNVYINNNNFLLFCENGQMLVVDREYGGYFDMSYKFECKTTNNEAIYQSSHGITACARNDNKITVYTMAAGPEVVEIQEETSLPEETVTITGDKAAEIVYSYGLEKPEFVYRLYYSEDEKYCFIQYWDYSFVIYDVEAGNIINTMDWAYPTDWCLGTDAEGYTYLLGYYGIYMMNRDMKPVMWMPDAQGVDMENRKVYLEWNGHHYEAPIYRVEELLAMAVSEEG